MYHEISLEELENVSGGRTLTEQEWNELLSARKKMYSITVSTPAAEAMLKASQKEFDSMFDLYLNMNRTGELGSEEVLFRDFVKSKASSGLYRLLYGA